MFEFECEFSYSDVVVFSCGVNDLSRYSHTATSLADTVYNKLLTCSRKYPRTKFVINSVLHTKFGWLNREIAQFNDIMYDFCQSVPNFIYFDSHGILCCSSIARIWEPAGNGLHITLNAKRTVTRELVKCLAFLTGYGTTRLLDRRHTQGDSYANPAGSYNRRY